MIEAKKSLEKNPKPSDDDDGDDTGDDVPVILVFESSRPPEHERDQ